MWKSSKTKDVPFLWEHPFSYHWNDLCYEKVMRKNMEQVFQVGIISSTHGVRGEVKVFPTTDDMKRFKKLKEILLDTGKEYMTLQIEGVKFFKQFVIECS